MNSCFERVTYSRSLSFGFVFLVSLLSAFCLALEEISGKEKSREIHLFVCLFVLVLLLNVLRYNVNRVFSFLALFHIFLSWKFGGFSFVLL